jgi:metal-dependent HD superfamily phosphatase/phosphodiesterase
MREQQKLYNLFNTEVMHIIYARDKKIMCITFSIMKLCI